MYVLVAKLKRLKQIIIKWKKERFQYMSAKVQEAKKEMQQAQLQVQERPLCPHVTSKERVAVKKYSYLVKYEESMLK